MVRLSLVNMYLHGFREPSIHEYDTLTSDERWNEYADVILANPPFMSPKGGIRPHNRFAVQSKRSEVLFVDYMAEHLTAKGRAGIIVPEGIIFQSQKAYRQLRKMLVEDYLVAVVSLPAGVFNPYSGVKTSILILDRALARRTDTIAFFKVENDGFDLGAQRRLIDRNDLPRVQTELGQYLSRLGEGEALDDFKSTLGIVVKKKEIASDRDYNLGGERYRRVVSSKSPHTLTPVGKFYRTNVKSLDPRSRPEDYFELWSIPAFDSGNPQILKGAAIGSPKKVVYAGDILLSRIIPHIRRSWVVKENVNDYCKVASTEWIVFSSDEIVPEFLQHMIISDMFHQQFMQTITGVGGSLSRANPKAVADIKIPIPPLSVQQEIVAEIEGYQKVIDGARAVVENYRPHIVVEPEWPTVALGTVVEILDSLRKPITKRDRTPGQYPYYGATGVLDYVDGYLFDEPLVLVGEDGAKWGSGEKSSFMVESKVWVNNHAHVLRPMHERLNDKYLTGILNQMDLTPYTTGVTVPKLNQARLQEHPSSVRIVGSSAVYRSRSRDRRNPCRSQPANNLPLPREDSVGCI